MYNNNFYPYYNYGFNNQSFFSKASAFANISKLNWNNILNSTQKTLSIINQAIPVIYQIKPIYNNAKTIFKVMNAIKEPEKNIVKNVENQPQKMTNTDNTTMHNNDSPTFFL